jgi:steroid delta-isomerase-like uncharacterized protein
MTAQATLIPPQQLIAAAKATVLAYNNKDWDSVRASFTSDCIYDEVSTNRKVQGIDQVIQLWQGWAAAFPDSKATFTRELACGNIAVLEVSWQGTHTGPLETPAGAIAPTGKPIDIRSCILAEIVGERTKLQRQYFDMVTLFQQLGIR